jgi:hypothetical protein
MLSLRNSCLKPNRRVRNCYIMTHISYIFLCCRLRRDVVCCRRVGGYKWRVNRPSLVTRSVRSPLTHHHEQGSNFSRHLLPSRHCYHAGVFPVLLWRCGVPLFRGRWLWRCRRTEKLLWQLLQTVRPLQPYPGFQNYLQLRQRAADVLPHRSM